MSSRYEIVAAMLAVAEAGLESPDDSQVQALAMLTKELLSLSPVHNYPEYTRFLASANRRLIIPNKELQEWIQGKAVMVTGGTGCIGSELLNQLRTFHAGRLISVSRGKTRPAKQLSDVSYRYVDIWDSDDLEHLFADETPSIVFHLAAQRDPGYAERNVLRTVATNIFGTRNVLAAAEKLEVAHLVYASTGKAMRPFTPDIYAGSKRASEWLISSAAEHEQFYCTGGRFTHVVDNSIVLRCLRDGCREGLVRLHGHDVLFYVQSGLESAQLLLCAGLTQIKGSFPILAIRDLGYPIDLMGLALGVINQSNSAVPIYFCGFPPGYEAEPYPRLYDQKSSWEKTPLFNAIEAAVATALFEGQVDMTPATFSPSSAALRQLQCLEELCVDGAPEPLIRSTLNDLSWTLLDASLQKAPSEVLARLDASAHRFPAKSRDHQRVDDAIRRWCQLRKVPG